jgi:hypothetical protein
MSKNSKFATISVAVFVGLFAVYLGGYQTGKSANPSTDTEQATLAISDAPVLAQTTEPQSSGEEPSPQLAAIDPQDVDPADIDWAAMRRSRDARGHWDPMIRAELIGMLDSHEFSDAEIAAYNKLHVLPFRAVASDYCRDNEAASTSGEALRCERIYKIEEPYAGVSDVDLAELAYNDAVAAALMGRRSADLQDRLRWSLRAIALSGKSGPALWVAEHNFMATRISKNGKTTPAYKDIFARYSLERLAFDLGDPRARPDEYGELMKAAFGDDAKKAFLDAESQIYIYKSEIDNIRQNLSLPDSVWGGDNA